MLHKDEQIGEYRLEKFLGRGQFGEVWLAEKQIQFSKKKIRHALKFLLSNHGEEINLKHAEDEIDTWIEAGGHPNVISVLDMIVYQGHVVIVSEYADGGSLKDWLRLNGGKAPSEEKAIELMFGILRGIEHLHSRNVVHRDLKPENILLQGDFPRITDFGISRIVSENTTTTKAIGSPSYMSPEAFLGNKSPQTDIWSAGVILYELLTGNLPFVGENIFQLKEAIDKENPAPLPTEISRELQDVVLKALQKDREKRLPTAPEMRLALETASYNLRKAVNDATVPYEETETVTLPNENKTEKRYPDQTQPVPTQAAINIPNHKELSKTQPAGLLNTDEKEIDKTRFVSDIQNEEDFDYEADLLKINPQAKRKTNATGAKFWMAGVIAIILVGVSIGAFFVLKPDSSTESNSNHSNSNTNTTVNNSPESPKGMAYIPGGEFTMGRDDGKSEAEKPAHKVSVKPFFMDLTEVTNEQYAEFVKAEKYRPPIGWTSTVFPTGQAKFPVVGVNWEDARAYAEWAGKRLPTEEEWEFAARGTENFLYPWGNDWKQGSANADGAGKTLAEAGKFGGKSPFGLSDMSGNAWEWTASDFKEYPNGKLPEAFAGKSNLKTIRGGSFEATRDFATATYRIGWAATGADNYSRTGFRCAKDTEQ